MTGESETVAKRTEALGGTDLPLGDRRNIAYHGSLVARGRGEGVVFAELGDSLSGQASPGTNVYSIGGNFAGFRWGDIGDDALRRHG